MRELIIPSKYKAPALSEIMQQVEVKFSLAKTSSGGTLEAVTPFVKCRDFLCDTVTATKALCERDFKSSFVIYGYFAKPEPSLIDDPLLVIKSPNDRTHAKLLTSLGELLGFFPYEFSLEEVACVKDRLIAISGELVRIFFRTPTGASLFSLLVKLPAVDVESSTASLLDVTHEVANSARDTNEKEYLLYIGLDRMRQMLTDLESTFLGFEEYYNSVIFGYYSKESYLKVHNESGIVSFLSRRTENNTSLED